MNKYMLLFFTFVLAMAGNAQSLRAYEAKAEATYTAGDYTGALAYYKVLLDVDSTQKEYIYRAGVSAFNIDAYERAAGYFTTIYTDHNAAYPRIAFQLAETYKRLGEYEQALEILTAIIEDNSNDADVAEAEKKAAEIEWAMEQTAMPDPIEIEHLGEKINTIYSDFGPLFHNGGLYYTSARLEEENYVETPRLKVYRYDEGAAEGTPIAANYNFSDSAHVAYYVPAPDGSRAYQAVCERTGITDYRCALYYWQKKAGGGEELIAMPPHINLDSFTTTQPATAILPNGSEVVFFVSNRPGGKGGLDIWYTVVGEDGSFSDPKNLEAINTAGDEVSPYFHRPSGMLFFSTDGRYTLGGLDIYSTQWNPESGWTIPEHAGYPLNSSYDDLYFTFNSDVADAYFTSNRPGCLCASDKKDCKCNDIYTYPIKVTLDVFVFHKITDMALTGSVVTLVDKATGETVFTSKDIKTNTFQIELELEKEYGIYARKKGWSTDSALISTRGIFKTTHFERILKLEPQIKLEIYTFDSITKAPLSGVRVAVTDLQTGYDEEETNLSGNDFYFQISSDASYKITGTKDFYSEAKSSLVTEGLIEPRVYKDSLYLTPFGDLPLVLYFDNDQPNPRTLSTTTNLSYAQTWKRYYGRRDAYIQKYGGAFSGSAKIAARQAMVEFFEKEVKRNFERLNGFSELLISYLSEGNDFEIIIEGFASPLANSDYNKNLTSRRIKSLINYLNNYSNGALKPYIENGDLRITEIPYGETKSADDVSDDPIKRTMSVYSISAAKERKVKVNDIRRFNQDLSLSKEKSKEAPSDKSAIKNN